MMSLLGTPSMSEIDYASESMKNLVKRSPWKPSTIDTLQDLSPYATDSFVDLMHRMLKFDPKQRLSADEVLDHPYMARGRSTYHSVLCKCCSMTETSKKMPVDLEPVASKFFNDRWEREITSVEVAKEKMHRYMKTLQSSGREQDLCYYADHLSDLSEPKGNFTIFAKNETTKSFHLNNLSYAGPIVMGVGGFIVVAACVMTFEARDSAAKVVPARFKMSTTIPQTSVCTAHSGYSRHGSLKTSGVQTTTASQHPHSHPGDRRALTQSFVSFSRGLVLDNQANKMLLKVPQFQGFINRSPSAPDLALERSSGTEQSISQSSVLNTSHPLKAVTAKKPRTFAACSLLNPGLLHRHALSVDETAGNYRMSNESLHPIGSHGSMTMDLHCDCPVTLRINDKRRNPLKRQRRVDEDGNNSNADSFRRSSHSCSVRGTSSNSLREISAKGGSAHQLPTQYSHCPPSRRRSSNASDCTQRVKLQSRGHLERTISSDSRLTGAIPKYQHHANQHSIQHIPKHSTEPSSQLSTDEDQGQ